MQITADKTGFPLVSIPNRRLEVSWLPFTKIQLEHFLADTNSPSFDQEWYDQICNINLRINPYQMDFGKYEGIFVTGILPSEIKLISQWMGLGFDIPTIEEWDIIFDHFYAYEATSDIIDQINNSGQISERAKIIVKKLDEYTNQDKQQLLNDTRRVNDQMLMRLGLMEYIYENNYRNTYAGQGQPNRHFHPHVRSLPRDKHEKLARQYREIGGRIRQYGFRLIRRG